MPILFGIAIILSVVIGCEAAIYFKRKA